MSAEVDVFGGSATENAIDKLASGKQTVFSTLTGDDFATKMAVLEATSDSAPLAENLNKPINLENVVIQLIDMVNEDSGEVETVPRTILIADDGNAYHAISSGVFRAIENIFGILGQPHTWPEPIPVKAIRGGSGTRQYMTLVPAK